MLAALVIVNTELVPGSDNTHWAKTRQLSSVGRAAAAATSKRSNWYPAKGGGQAVIDVSRKYAFLRVKGTTLYICIVVSFLMKQGWELHLQLLNG